MELFFFFFFFFCKNESGCGGVWGLRERRRDRLGEVNKVEERGGGWRGRVAGKGKGKGKGGVGKTTYGFFFFFFFFNS